MKIVVKYRTSDTGSIIPVKDGTTIAELKEKIQKRLNGKVSSSFEIDKLQLQAGKDLYDLEEDDEAVDVLAEMNVVRVVEKVPDFEAVEESDDSLLSGEQKQEQILSEISLEDVVPTWYSPIKESRVLYVSQDLRVAHSSSSNSESMIRQALGAEHEELEHSDLQYFQSIQDAIDVSMPGDVIIVHSGHYEERIRIEGKERNNLRIVGVGNVIVSSNERSVFDFRSGAAWVSGITFRQTGGSVSDESVPNLPSFAHSASASFFDPDDDDDDMFDQADFLRKMTTEKEDHPEDLDAWTQKLAENASLGISIIEQKGDKLKSDTVDDDVEAELSRMKFMGVEERASGNSHHSQSSNPKMDFSGCVRVHCGHLLLEKCDISSSWGRGIIVVVPPPPHRTVPCIRKCKIHDTHGAGVSVIGLSDGWETKMVECNESFFIRDQQQQQDESSNMESLFDGGFFVKNEIFDTLQSCFEVVSNLGVIRDETHSNTSSDFLEPISTSTSTTATTMTSSSNKNGHYLAASGWKLNFSIDSCSNLNPLIKENNFSNARTKGMLVACPLSRPTCLMNSIVDNHAEGLSSRLGAAALFSKNVVKSNSGAGISISSGSRGTFKQNTVEENLLSGIQISEYSTDPMILKNVVSLSGEAGIDVFGGAEGMIVENEIFENKGFGISIETRANPTIRGNTLRNGLAGGLTVFEGGKGLVEQNEIFENAFANIAIRSRGAPVIRRNTITKSLAGGVFIFEDGMGEIVWNEITHNSFAGIEIMSRARPTVRNNKICSNSGSGVWVYSSGSGVIEHNEIYANGDWGVKLDGVALESFQGNAIHDHEDGRDLYQKKRHNEPGVDD